MRSFIGINFSWELKQEISRIQNRIREQSLKGRFKHIDNFHITLKFLGEIAGQQPAEISGRLKEIAAKHQSFQLRLGELGCFKGREGIRTLYIGLAGDLEALKQLNRDTEAAMELLGFKRENRPFTPHITIAQDLVLNESFENLKKHVDSKDSSVIHVDRVELIKSEQIQNKRIYTPVSGYDLVHK